MILIYGIKNCDTVKKARAWFEKNQLSYRFHDLRQDGLSREQIEQWLAQVGTDVLLNRRSTTWKALSETEKAQVESGDASLIQQHPTLIKRPLLEWDGRVHTGYSEELFSTLFAPA